MVDFSSPTCFASDTIIGGNMLPMYAAFLLLALATVVLLRKAESPKTKIAIVYIHLTFLFMPVALMSTNTACGFSCGTCHNNASLLLVYSVPVTAVAALLLGFAAVPAYYTLSSRKMSSAWIRKFVSKESGRLRLRAPDVRIFNSARPIAFSFRSIKSAIFLSIGSLDILNRKEVEAVILHELAHIKRMDSLSTLSRKLMKFSPFYAFAGFGDSNEEKMADMHASGVQATSRHVNSARKKISLFKRMS